MTALGTPDPDPQLVADIDALFTPNDHQLLAGHRPIPAQGEQR
ncbi:hypothetical protein [Streptomyces sp. NPDC093589]